MFGILKRLFGKPDREPIDLEEQLRVLAECGVKPRPGTALDDLFTPDRRLLLERRPYLGLLTEFGGQVWTPESGLQANYCSDDIWHFDSECIEDHGDYAAIATRMAVLAKGDLPLNDTRDYVDVEAEEARLSFGLDGDRHEWQAKVDNDWVDERVFQLFIDLLATRSTSRRYTYIDLQGQDCLIGCASEPERAALEGATGVRVEWLN